MTPVEIDSLNRELVDAARQLAEYAGHTTTTPEQDRDADALEQRIDEMQERLEELNQKTETKVKTSHRLTSPGRIGGPNYGRDHEGSVRDGVRVGDPIKDSSFCGIHKLRAGELTDGGFSSLAEFFEVLTSERFDPRIQSLRAASGIISPGSGGVMVPTAFLVDSIHPPTESEIVLPRCSKFSMPVETLHISGVSGLSNSSGAVHGFTPQWSAEHGQLAEDEIETSRITLQRKKLTLYTLASNELVLSSDFERELLPAMNDAVGYERDAAYLTGTGTGQPRGALNCPSTISVAKEVGQPASTVMLKNLSNMLSRLHPALFGESVWVVSPSTLPSLLELSQPIGTAGSPVPVMNGSGGLTIFTRPVLFSSKLPALGQSGDVILAAWSQYAVGMAPGIIIDKSEHVGFRTDQVAWRARYFTDGQAKWASAFQPQNGPTQSWCVKLDARS